MWLILVCQVDIFSKGNIYLHEFSDQLCKSSAYETHFDVQLEHWYFQLLHFSLMYLHSLLLLWLLVPLLPCLVRCLKHWLFNLPREDVTVSCGFFYWSGFSGRLTCLSEQIACVKESCWPRIFLDIVNDPENVLSNIFFSVYFISLASHQVNIKLFVFASFCTINSLPSLW